MSGPVTLTPSTALDLDSLEKSLPWPSGMWLTNLRAFLFREATGGSPTLEECQVAKAETDRTLHGPRDLLNDQDFWRIYGRALMDKENPRNPAKALQEVLAKLDRTPGPAAVVVPFNPPHEVSR